MKTMITRNTDSFSNLPSVIPAFEPGSTLVLRAVKFGDGSRVKPGMTTDALALRTL